jgi:hypothetical protein
MDSNALETPQSRKRAVLASNLLLGALLLSFCNYCRDLSAALLYRLFALPILGLYIFCGWLFYRVRSGKEGARSGAMMLVSCVFCLDLVFFALNIYTVGWATTLLKGDRWYPISQVALYALVSYALVLLYRSRAR